MSDKSKEYKIQTFSDMVNCTNPENLDGFINDLKMVLSMAHLVKGIAELKGAKEDDVSVQEYFMWTDDGINEVNMDLQDKGESYGTLKAKSKDK